MQNLMVIHPIVVRLFTQDHKCQLKVLKEDSEIASNKCIYKISWQAIQQFQQSIQQFLKFHGQCGGQTSIPIHRAKSLVLAVFLWMLTLYTSSKGQLFTLPIIISSLCILLIIYVHLNDTKQLNCGTTE